MSDNFQNILGEICQVGQNGRSDEARFFFVQYTIGPTLTNSQQRSHYRSHFDKFPTTDFHQIWSRTCISMSSRKFSCRIFKNFLPGVICQKTPQKWKCKTGIVLWKSFVDALRRCCSQSRRRSPTVTSSQSFPTMVSFWYEVRFQSYGRQISEICSYLPIFRYKTPKTYLSVNILQPGVTFQINSML